MELTAVNVEKIFFDCLFEKREEVINPVIANGVNINAGFNPEKIKEHANDISDMLTQLPRQFHKGSGDGWSFLNACENRDGKQWADSHLIIDQLICLGIAIGKARFCFPRDMWNVFPGGMTYFVIE